MPISPSTIQASQLFRPTGRLFTLRSDPQSPRMKAVNARPMDVRARPSSFGPNFPKSTSPIHPKPGFQQVWEHAEFGLHVHNGKLPMVPRLSGQKPTRQSSLLVLQRERVYSAESKQDMTGKASPRTKGVGRPDLLYPLISYRPPSPPHLPLFLLRPLLLALLLRRKRIHLVQPPPPLTPVPLNRRPYERKSRRRP